MAEQQYTGYCVRCKEKDREMQDVEVVTIESRGGERRAAKGTCAECGTKMMKFLPNEDK